jgi:hypothetical protein
MHSWLPVGSDHDALRKLSSRKIDIDYFFAAGSVDNGGSIDIWSNDVAGYSVVLVSPPLNGCAAVGSREHQELHLATKDAGV